MQIATSLAVLDVPWVIKPLYGMVSDFLPLFGYRRRSYLLLANAAAIAAFLWTTQVLAPAAIVFALLLTAIAMAISSTVCGALLVENGQKHNASASIHQPAVAVVQRRGDGRIAARRRADRIPVAGRRSARRGRDRRRRTGRNRRQQSVAGRRGAAPASTWPSSADALRGFLDTFRSRTLWLIAAFLFCYYFSPGFGTPLYFHMTDHLRFSQGTIGMLSSDQRRRLDRRRPDLPLPAARHDNARAAQPEHPVRHAGDAGVPRPGR